MDFRDSLTTRFRPAGFKVSFAYFENVRICPPAEGGLILLSEEMIYRFHEGQIAPPAVAFYSRSLFPRLIRGDGAFHVKIPLHGLKRWTRVMLTNPNQYMTFTGPELPCKREKVNRHDCIGEGLAGQKLSVVYMDRGHLAIGESRYEGYPKSDFGIREWIRGLKGFPRKRSPAATDVKRPLCAGF